MDHTALFDNFPEPAVAVTVQDREPIVSAVNSVFESTFDTTAETALGESLEEILEEPGEAGETPLAGVHPADDSGGQVAGRDSGGTDVRERGSGDREQVDREIVADTVDGPKSFQVRRVPADGEAVYYAVFEDVTERKQRRAELARYEAIVEHTEDGIYVFDRDGYFEFVNQRVLDVSGLPYDAWIGEHVSIHEDLGTLTSDEVAEIEAGIDAVTSGVADEVRVILRPDLPHDLDYLELRLAPFSVDGEPERVLAFSRDVTEHRVRERELERKNERLDRFASLVSHDLRNPLNVAQGRLELAREDCESENLARVADAHDRMVSLIEDLLTLARQGERVSDLNPVDLESLAGRCWENVQTPGGTIAVETDATILADQTANQNLLENLFRNAVEHGGEDVTVTVGSTPEGFYVADDGDGIPESERDQVFDPGYSTSPEGTGFGLSIVKEIAAAHDWDVRVTEGEEGGARFEFTDVERVDEAA